MRQYRGLWAGASLLLVLVGCSKDNKKINNPGVYSPIITGLSSDYNPAARGIPNHLTVIVTNVNGLPLTYHWSSASGTMTDTTNATATWTPPDTIGTYDVTVSIQAQDGDNQYFKTQTYHVYVDNEYQRWTRSDRIQFDPAPINGGGVLYAEISNNLTGASDAYRVETPLAGGTQLTDGFRTVASPTPRADRSEFAIHGVPDSTNAVPGLFLLPWGGGDLSTARLVAQRNPYQQKLEAPRFSRTAAFLLYGTDSVRASPDPSVTEPYAMPAYRDAANFTAPRRFVLENAGEFFYTFSPANWGPDLDNNGLPDSVIARGIFFPDIPFARTVYGLYKFAADSLTAYTSAIYLADTSATDPDWSPDGQHIVFSRWNGITGDRDIWVINAHSSDPATAVRVTSGPADDSHPRFSDDGSTIYFVSNRADNYGVSGIFGTERRGTNIWSVSQFDKP